MKKNSIPIKLIKFYQRYISPRSLPRCKFYPTCSNYARQAYEKYTFLKATILVIIRILKCNPFSKVGYDPLK